MFNKTTDKQYGVRFIKGGPLGGEYIAPVSSWKALIKSFTPSTILFICGLSFRLLKNTDTDDKY